MVAIQKTVPTYPVDPQDRIRADYYGLLGHLFFAPPDAGLLGALAQSGELDGGTPLSDAWNALRHAARASTAEAVRVEYDEAFLGVGKPAVMLYASFYLSGFLNEKPLAELRSQLTELGLARRAALGEPEDHFAGLADVMRQLILDECRTADWRDAAQAQFFSRFIEPCYGRLCDAVDGVAGATFYRSLGGFARAFLDVEKTFFSIEQPS